MCIPLRAGGYEWDILSLNMKKITVMVTDFSTPVTILSLL